MADPYWYEWTVGEKYIIDMLIPENNIKYVELQANVSLGLDDVVITYCDGKTRFIQVKHTRVNNRLTFGDMVAKESGSKSLLEELAESWAIEVNKYNKAEVHIYTNRIAGDRKSSADGHSRPPLCCFFEDLKKQLKTVDNIHDIRFPKYQEAWQEWCLQLGSIESDENKLTFLQCLHIDANQEDLPEIKSSVLNQIKKTFHASDVVAESLLAKLDHAMREWTTTSRKTSRIASEDVYSALSISDTVKIYNHDLIPADPFFKSREQLVQQLENELRYGKEKLIFLSGIPGTGKTTIVSKLCNKRLSVVDIRYYAYEPIEPSKEYLSEDVSERVKYDTFWSELFNQLRILLAGQLHKYNVPVVNSLMNKEELRSQFLSIASAYAKDNNKIFTIAIDGIDHAARAGSIQDTFLPSLPNPEYIPQNIKILLSGQPKENYSGYPKWLFEENTCVKQIDISDLCDDDILSLVTSTFPQKAEKDARQMSMLIGRYAQGNTLAAIFAVHEATKQPDLVSLDKTLKDRKLSGNISDYYNEIWKKTQKEIAALPFVDYKVAGIFAMFNEQINAEKLKDIFCTENISISDWNNVLKALSPLLHEKNGNFTILHNDVRVFLSSIIGVDANHVKEISGNIVDYYLRGNKSKAFYHDIFELLKQASREGEFARFYDANFIIEAYVHGIETDYLRNVTKELLDNTLARDAIDWNNMHILSIGFMTINQIDSSQYEIEDCIFRDNNRIIDISPYECFVEAESAWNKRIVKEVLALVKKLYKCKEYQRSKTLFTRWFSGITLKQIWNCINSAEDKDQNPADLENNEIAKLLGECICITNETGLLRGAKKMSTQDEMFVMHMMESFFHNAIIKFSGEELKIALQSQELLYLEPLVTGIKELLSANRISDLNILEYELSKRHIDSNIGTLIDTFLRIVTKENAVLKEETKSLWDKIENVEIPADDYKNTMTYYSMFALVSAYLQVGKTRSVIVREITDSYIEKFKYRNRKYFSMYFNNICMIGKWSYALQNKIEFCESKSDIALLMKALFLKKWSINDKDFETMDLMPYILKAYIDLAKKYDTYQSVIENICLKVFESNPANQILDAGAYYYQNDVPRMQRWFDYWLEESGKVWDESLYERNQIIKSFINIKAKYDLKDKIDISYALDRAQWSVIGYASHKEYSCNDMLSWYNCLVGFDIDMVIEYAKKIKRVSDQVDRLGDNRLRYDIDSKVYSDIFSCGFDAIIDTIKDNYYLSQGLNEPELFVDGLIGYLHYSSLDKTQLMAIWSIGMGLLDWRDDANHATLFALQRAIELCAENNQIENITDELEKMGKAYVNLGGDPIRYSIPTRWCDRTKDATLDGDALAIVQNHIDEGGESGNHKYVIEALKQLKQSGYKEIKVLGNELLDYELEKAKYGIGRNSLIKYIVQQLVPDNMDDAIKSYLVNAMRRGNFYPEEDLPEIVRWKIPQLGIEYCKNGLDEVLKMQSSWMTGAGYFKEPECLQEIDYVKLIDWDKVSDIETLFYQVLKCLILSEIEEVVRTALIGLYALIKTDNKYIELIEDDWNEFHYMAKEWILMLYELRLTDDTESKAYLKGKLLCHCKDEEFNVALYANVLVKTFYPDQFNGFIKEKQAYFDRVPDIGFTKMIVTDSKKQWLERNEYVMNCIANLRVMLDDDFDDIERRTSDYYPQLPEPKALLALQRKKPYMILSLSNVNRAFYRVMYKDWIKGRWDGAETDIARIVLSATEPYILLKLPGPWPFNNGELLENAEKHSGLKEENQSQIIEETIKTGIRDDEIVVSGAVTEYTHKEKIFGFTLSYLELYGYSENDGINAYERNSRLLLQMQEDFYETPHLNITMHHNGVENFNDSGISCGFSKTALKEFGWEIVMEKDDLKIVDSEGNEIGRFEQYSGNRQMGNQCNSDQPYMQRWVMKKDVVHGIENDMKTNVKVVSSEVIEEIQR